MTTNYSKHPTSPEARASYDESAMAASRDQHIKARDAKIAYEAAEAEVKAATARASEAKTAYYEACGAAARAHNSAYMEAKATYKAAYNAAKKVAQSRRAPRSAFGGSKVTFYG